jgi:HK97 family phage portal protein
VAVPAAVEKEERLMDLLGRLLTGGGLRAGVPGPADDYWYQPVGTVSAAGMRVDGNSAQMISAWYRGRDILASVLAMLPLHVYERLPNDGGADVAARHPLEDVLHDKPNDAEDSYQWRRQAMFDIIDFGWFYCWIVPGARGFADQLVRIDPTLVTPKRQVVTLPNGATMNGRWLFDVRGRSGGVTKTYTQDEIFYLRGAGGKGILEYARTSLGTALATETYAAQIFSKGILNGGVLEIPAALDPVAGKRMAESYVTKMGDWHMPIVLEQGAKLNNQNLLTPEDAQMLLSRRFSIDDMARWLGVPRLMLENSDPSYGNAEQFTQNFIDINMGGWLSMWEFGINDQLILNPVRFFARFTREAFVRSKFFERWQGHVMAVNAGIVSVDEVRSIEDMNKRGGKANELREPQNITGKPTAAATGDGAASAPPASPSAADGGSKATAIAQASAARVLRKEVLEVRKLAVRHQADGDAFAIAVAAFYASHVALVADALQMSRVDAERYCAGQAAQMVTGDWLAVLDVWKTDDYAAGLAAIALEEAA